MNNLSSSTNFDSRNTCPKLALQQFRAHQASRSRKEPRIPIFIQSHSPAPNSRHFVCASSSTSSSGSALHRISLMFSRTLFSASRAGSSTELRSDIRGPGRPAAFGSHPEKPTRVGNHAAFAASRPPSAEAEGAAERSMSSTMLRSRFGPPDVTAEKCVGVPGGVAAAGLK